MSRQPYHRLEEEKGAPPQLQNIMLGYMYQAPTRTDHEEKRKPRSYFAIQQVTVDGNTTVNWNPCTNDSGEAPQDGFVENVTLGWSLGTETQEKFISHCHPARKNVCCEAAVNEMEADGRTCCLSTACCPCQLAYCLTVMALACPIDTCCLLWACVNNKVRVPYLNARENRQLASTFFDMDPGSLRARVADIKHQSAAPQRLSMS
jgi:hypothetical protein